MINVTTCTYNNLLKHASGKVRVAFTDENGTPLIVQKNNYYPFGLLMAERTNTATNKNPYLYNGKEMFTGEFYNWYDYGARFYAADLGRFMVIDPKAEMAVFQSPYVYAGNSPITSIDYNGEFKVEVTQGAQQAGVNQQNMSNFNRVAANVGSILTANPHVLNTMVEQTGMSADQIKGMMVWGEGPTISIDDKSGDLYGAEGNARGISIDANIVKQIGSMNEGDEGYDAALFSLGMLILHEATHYGDATTNGETTTGINGDTGNQNTTSSYGHRGIDTDVAILGTGASSYTPKDKNGNWTLATGQAKQRLSSNYGGGVIKNLYQSAVNAFKKNTPDESKVKYE